ncbi:major facilitator superfamily domain-containing protein [Aspergillus pseudotamarii]|uniref:Major facilitator superfamily domain-containing protein n=1 Tax=Aspergillus pseudotamarii TaxID=132259 RepID=A0A5N6SVX1_ASPPS|nr:major facilitator superfamily domain-containing protein [Aspergillus pseudotamarii]KAE8138805.1 major facilitator superfamily domain-containing protein [Aspergillus pseudotamarii]
MISYSSSMSAAFRYYIAILVCLAVLLCNFLAAGPTVAIEQTTIDFLGPMGSDASAHISRISFFYSTTFLMQGVGMLFWMPLIIKFGRRPIYVISFVLYVGTGLWCGFAKTYSVELAGRVIMGLAAGAGECLGPMTITDIFFLHERGAAMSLYTAALSVGVAAGIIIDGVITISLHWRYIYYVATALIGGVTLLVIFTFPETTFDRNSALEREATSNLSVGARTASKTAVTSEHRENAEPETLQIGKKPSYLSALHLFNGIHTSEPLFRIFLRPIVLIILPPVLWTSLVFAVTIGFLVAITSNFATAFSTTYNFAPWQSGLCFIAGLIGSLIGIAFGGQASDWVADWLTRRNNGIRQPEMRLPSIAIGGVCAPAALVLYGVGVNNNLHWIAPTIALGLLNFAIVQATNVAMVYVIDSYRPSVGEITVSILAFKAAFGFLLSFYTNPWINLEGYSKAFGEMACIAGVIILIAVPFYYWGRAVRHRTWKWRIMEQYGRWGADRDVGE